ncbi:hypothetical protein CHU32_24985 [Superficieibacter electus]|uniref:Uncharacterized protein n=1 Tax=Superficieibacter electus TaxID=2022662 RepID=A0A2P5GHY4_9ENTR|nr:hypothetical protein CHU32_24985 [Superficieibacter electus]POP47977.1 hypothetical protein CHU33_02220 [Superficieibacter electus]
MTSQIYRCSLLAFFALLLNEMLIKLSTTQSVNSLKFMLGHAGKYRVSRSHNAPRNSFINGVIIRDVTALRYTLLLRPHVVRYLPHHEGTLNVVFMGVICWKWKDMNYRSTPCVARDVWFLLG